MDENKMVYCKRCGKKLPENALFCPGCGMTLSGDGTQDETLLPVGTVLNKRYRIEQYLASGGFGNTYKVIDLNLDEAFAVKEFFNRTINNRNPATRVVSANNTTNLVDFKAQLNKFRKEALRMRRIEGDHIVHVHDIFDEHGTCYYVMDFIDGESLSALLKRRGALPEAEVLGYLEQMLLGLDEIHRHSIWHLDLKPGNMMVDRDGKLLLIDFGASKLVDLERGAMTSSMAMAYTPGYAPIEQTEQNIAAIGAPTDLYALGATLYNLLTGEQPPTISELMQGPSAFHFPPEVSPAMRELIGNLMQVQKEQRPQDVAQVHHYIDTHYFGPAPAVSTDDATVSAPSPKVVRIYDDDADVGRSQMKKWIVAAACVTFAVIAAALGGLWLYRNNELQQEAMAQQKAQQDSIAAAQATEQARQDSIAAAEQARQDSINSLHQAIIDSYLSKVQTLPECDDGGYYLKDISEDGIPELWLDTGTCEGFGGHEIFGYIYENAGLKSIYHGGGHNWLFEGSDYLVCYGAIQGYESASRITYRNGRLVSKKIFDNNINEALDAWYDNGMVGEQPTYEGESKLKEKFVKLISKNNTSPIRNMFN